MKKIIFTLFLVLFIGLVPHVFAAVAQQGFTALAPIPGLTDPATLNTASGINANTLANFFNNLYKFLIGLAAILAIIEIIWGGLEYSTQDSISKKSDGKHRIYQAIFGLVLVLSPVLVFSIINPSILNLSLNLDPLDTISKPMPVAGGDQTTLLGACTGSSCGKNITIIYYAAKKVLDNSPGTGAPSNTYNFDPSTGKVISGQNQTSRDNFVAGCVGGGISTSNENGLNHCPDPTLDYYNVCYNVTLTCQANATNQFTNTGTTASGQTAGCTVSGIRGILQFANCLSSTAAQTWGTNNCTSWGNLKVTSAGTATAGGATHFVASCEGKQNYLFVDTSTASSRIYSSSQISWLQPLVTWANNLKNADSAAQFASICKSESASLNLAKTNSICQTTSFGYSGWSTCVSRAPLGSSADDCSPTQALLNGNKCYIETLSCEDLCGTNCSVSPNWSPVQN